jgi:UDP-4-amino-4,6-dideoxy-N-acetyl-beta-L-altrosamine N-acetyltransferase
VLREATESDLESIRTWRNHPRVRAAHLFQDEITPDRHREWWRQVLSDSGRRVLVFEFDGRAAGVVHFKDHDPTSGTAEWGFFLDIDGLGPALTRAWIALEREAIEYAFATMGLHEFGGRTLATNAPVLALHHRFGFRDVPGRGYRTVAGGVEQDVIWTTMTRSMWASEEARRSANLR